MISVLMPSRGRPKQLEIARNSALNLAAGEVEVLVYVDEDDPTKDQYDDVIIGPPLMSAQAISYLMTIAKGDLMFMGADDMVWSTKYWDKALTSKMPNHQLSVLFCNDGRGGHPPLFSKRFIKTVGPFPEIFRHFGLDDWVYRIAKEAGLAVFVPEVEIRHFKNKHSPIGQRARRLDSFENVKEYIESHKADISESASLLRKEVEAH